MFLIILVVIVAVFVPSLCFSPAEEQQLAGFIL